jgi:hypothetical protein
MTERVVVPAMDPGSEKSEFVTEAFVQELAVQVSDEKSPLVPHTTVFVPWYPALHVTVTTSPVVPAIELGVALSE